MKSKLFYEIMCRKGVAEIIIYGVIGGCGEYGASKFIRDFRAIEEPEVLIRINSPGGGMFDAISIYNLLKESDKRIVTQVDGMAASAASVIFAAGDQRIMPANTSLLIHNPWVLAAGDENKMRKTAEWLHKWTEQLIDIYHETSGMEREKIAEMMKEETVMTAKEAKKHGFCDKIEAALEVAASSRVLEQFMMLYHPDMIKEKQEEETNMDQIAALTAEIKGLQTEIEGYKTELEKERKLRADAEAKQKQIEVEARVDKDIAERRILQKARNIAIKILSQSEADYKEFVDNYEMPAMDRVEIPEGKDGGELTFAKLLDDPELLERTRRDNPQLYQKLYQKYTEGGV